MAGDGYYEKHSATQATASSLGLDALRVAADGIDTAGESVVRIADLGAAQGRSSLGPLRLAVELLGDRGHELEVVHTDLAGNDWATLFDVIEHDPASYLAGRDDVHPLVIGRSFYDRLVAPATIGLAWTSSSLHWLSEPAGPVPDHFFAPMSADQEARARYRTRSAQDWTRFLGHRAVELRPSGAIVFVDVLMGDDGTMGSEALFDALEATLRESRARGDLSTEEYAATTYPSWFRSLDEHRAPFRPTLPGPDGQELSLEALDPVELADPYWPAYERSGDARAYGRAQAGFLRGFLEPSFRAAWRRPADEQLALADAVFTACAERIAAEPSAMRPHYRLVVGRVRRTV